MGKLERSFVDQYSKKEAENRITIFKGEIGVKERGNWDQGSNRTPNSPCILAGAEEFYSQNNTTCAVMAISYLLFTR